MKPAPQPKKRLRGQELSPVERQTYTIEEAAKILGICRGLRTGQECCPRLRSLAGGDPKQALERDSLAETT